MRILVANRGEIARRVLRTARRLGHETVAVFAEPDRGAPFTREATQAVCLGPANLAETYLSKERLLRAAEETGAAAVHPGYGFLSENAAFARAVARAGLVFVGPHPEAIERMGSKIEARRLANEAGVPTIPGFDDSQDPADLAAAALRIGYPVLVKAAAGGGGRGIRIVREADAFEEARDAAAGEALRSFGDARLIVERYIERARHVEVQVLGDAHGNVIDLGTRECSVQRRYQKLLEEAPAPNLPDATREGLRRTAREMARSIGYDSAGTVEYVVDDETGEFFFLEMNTRLQVEHPVTEAITGLDLVELQLACAEGRTLPLRQEDVTFRGHAFEARINAEDASAGFLPRVGTVTALRVPEGVRWESGIEVGSVVTPHYDSMLAKLVTWGATRDAARESMARGLEGLVLDGVVHNTGFHRWLVEQPPVVDGRVTTSFLDTADLPSFEADGEPARLAAGAWQAAREQVRGDGVWSALGAFRVTPHRPCVSVFLEDRRGTGHDVECPEPARLEGDSVVVGHDDALRRVPVHVDLEARRVALNLAGETHGFRVLSRSERWAPSDAEGHAWAEATRAPFPAVVTETPVAAGDSVAAGDVVVVVEAMKMLHSLAARGAGVVEAVHVAVGDPVESDQVLVSYVPAEGDAQGD